MAYGDIVDYAGYLARNLIFYLFSLIVWCYLNNLNNTEKLQKLLEVLFNASYFNENIVKQIKDRLEEYLKFTIESMTNGIDPTAYMIHNNKDEKASTFLLTAVQWELKKFDNEESQNESSQVDEIIKTYTIAETKEEDAETKEYN